MLLWCVLSATFCPPWTLSDHSSIDTDSVIFGTVAKVSCDVGFELSNDKLVDAVECVSSEGEYPEALWNFTDIRCQREFDSCYSVFSKLPLATAR